MSGNKVLISGAGPIGLAAALFLSSKNIRPRIVDKALEINKYSKALLVNARSLQLLEKTGATKVFTDTRQKPTAAHIYYNKKLVIANKFDFHNLNVPYPFAILSPQSYSEQVFASLLEQKGIKVERGIEVTQISTNLNKAEVSLKHVDGREDTGTYDYVFAADGAHSTIRKKLGLKFEGTVINKTFNMYDAHITTKLNPTVVHAFLFKDNMVFMINVQDDVWRLISFSENPEELVGEFVKVEKIDWKSKFIAHHRIIEKFSQGRVFFGGDAAHVHSPLGGRGMNLGIEDAYVFAELMQSGRLDEYSEKRLKVAHELIPRIEKLTKLLAQPGLLAKNFRFLIPFIMPRVFNHIREDTNKFLLGLDHEI